MSNKNKLLLQTDIIREEGKLYYCKFNNGKIAVYEVEAQKGRTRIREVKK